jgi:hypothetical protein
MAQKSPLAPIRRLIFLYFWLLMFEGGLRFWVLPGLSNVLLLVRDPVVCLIYMMAVAAGVMPRNGIIGFTALLAMLTGVTSFGGDAPWQVTLYGLRSNFLHIPMIYVMARVLTGQDVLLLGRWLMWLMIPMAALVVYQFRSPVGSWINQGGMPTQYGTVRPAGTFAFVSGMVCFSSLVAAFLANSFAMARRGGWFLSSMCAAGVLASLAVSGSRSTVLSVSIVLVMFVGLAFIKTQAARGGLVMVGVLGLGAAGLTSTEFFEEGQEQLVKRFTAAAQGGGVIESGIGRTLGMFNYPIWAAQSAPLLGNGLGTGTNAGYALMTGGRGFGGGQETEWGRIMYESGAFLGSLFILLRVVILVQMFQSGWAALKRNNILCLLLFGAAGMTVVMGTWGIANTQGFATFGAGLCLASVKVGLGKRRPAVKKVPVQVWESLDQRSAPV